MKMKRSNIMMLLLKIPMDVACLCAAYSTIYYIRNQESFLISKPEFAFFMMKASLLFILVAAMLDAYSLNKKKPSDSVLFTLVVWLGITIAYFFVRKKLFFSRFILLGGLPLAFIFIKAGRFVIRSIHRQLHKRGIGKSRIIMVGHDANIEKMAQKMSREIDTEVIGYIAANQGDSKMQYLGKLEEYKHILASNDADEIIMVSEHVSLSEEILEYCLQNRITYRFLPSLLALHSKNIEVESVHGFPVIELKPTPIDGWGRVIKRIIDIIGAILGLILTAPIWLFASIGVKMSGPGPIIFAMNRVNQGKNFKIYKFRSMIPGAAAMKDELMQKNERSEGPLFKMENDPRVTKFGQFIRNTRIDELPQLINVLKGEMSLVGPRPHEEKEIAQYKKHQLKTLSIKPGITGISQITGNSDLSFDEEVRLDMYYIENWSLIWDFKIIAKTILFVLQKSDKNV